MKLSLILLFPLIGFLINGFYQLYSVRTNHKTNINFAGVVATIAMFLSFMCATVISFNLFSLPEGGRILEEVIFTWIHLANLKLDFLIRLDSLSAVFVLVITGVGSLIHLYSIGYLHHDKSPARYFSYLNLFCFMMLILVLGGSLPVVFMGWEGVGLASYLLIGYWYQDYEKVKAGQKAFVMNRIGDLGFLLAMFVVYQAIGTLDLLGIANGATHIEPATATVFGLLIFFACTGKSAQIPLFTWLPDAMAGPTPVSALIHAATMVTSGIYLLTRLSAVISLSEVVLTVIATVGGATALIAATIACAQSDIKKILAYSTVSQLGLMFLACGVGAFDSAVFHVMTHAFFKALLFLGAGSIIHALHEEQNIFKMGALRKKLPITFFTFVLAWAAILGLPPFSGFFSKDEILIQALKGNGGGLFFFVTAVATSFLTAFYMTRLLILVFAGTNRVDSKVQKKIHESPMVMILPLCVLALLSVVGGLFGAPYNGGAGLVHTQSHDTIDYLIMAGSVVMALIAAFIAYKKYNTMNEEERMNPFLQNAWNFNSVYNTIFNKGLKNISTFVSQFLEEAVIQRFNRWLSAVIDLSGNMIRVAQVGSMQVYLILMVIFASAILFTLLSGATLYAN